ncbi:hypothetical protein DL93DRAFT_2167483 [Clavulina sp. PMI_390]|nr:hypothetical protein DL93DRAFT_2167483 [Clavulina sp. PMI_390]
MEVKTPMMSVLKTRTSKITQNNMPEERQINEDDLQSFFTLHDLDGDHILDGDEIEAIYRIYDLDSQNKAPKKARRHELGHRIVREVLAKMEPTVDGMLTRDDFDEFDFESLPDLSALGTEGLHYDKAMSMEEL